MEKIWRKFHEEEEISRADRSAECLRIRRTEFTRRDWCLRDAAEIPGKYYAGGCLRFACFVYRFAEEPSPPRDESSRTKREGDSRNEKAGNYNPVRLFFFLQTEDVRVFERDQNQNGMFETSLTKFSVTFVLFIRQRESGYAPIYAQQNYIEGRWGEKNLKNFFVRDRRLIHVSIKESLVSIAIKNSKRDSRNKNIVTQTYVSFALR